MRSAIRSRASRQHSSSSRSELVAQVDTQTHTKALECQICVRVPILNERGLSWLSDNNGIKLQVARCNLSSPSSFAETNRKLNTYLGGPQLIRKKRVGAESARRVVDWPYGLTRTRSNQPQVFGASAKLARSQLKSASTGL